VESLVKQFVPFAPREPLFSLTTTILLQSVIIGVIVGVIAVVYPAWRASRLYPAAALKGE
jgi:ABC-type antimicrobial peptide transport system permease subunit